MAYSKSICFLYHTDRWNSFSNHCFGSWDDSKSAKMFTELSIYKIANETAAYYFIACLFRLDGLLKFKDIIN